MQDEFLIKVTQKHINNGEKHSCEKCPIALAVMETFRAEYVSVAGRIIILDSPLLSRVRSFATPDKALVFMEKFDLKMQVFPFEFIISY